VGLISTRFTALTGLLVLLAHAPDIKAQSSTSDPSTLADQTLDQLLNTPVITVGKRAQRLSKVPAAVYVITKEEIHRSGATTIPELLRMAPGVQVARINATQWAISVRGFNGLWSNKLLVMIDGRTIYSDIFSGVNWEMQDAVLENIDRIEVVRGPGSSVWGANAMNGVINIVTKPAADTPGTTLAVSGGNLQKFQATAQYGGSFGDTTFRVYGKDTDDSLPMNNSALSPSSHKQVTGGFRIDSTLDSRDTLTVQGDGYIGRTTDWEFPFPTLLSPIPQMANIDGHPASFDLQAKWVRTLSDHSELSIQAFGAHTQRSEAGNDARESTFDVELQHSFTLGQRNSVLWGMQARSVTDRLLGTPTAYFVPINQTDILTAGFVSDDIALVRDRLELNIGTKLEKFNFTHLQTEPSARLAWTPNDTQTVWASVGRAVRVPSRYERDIRLDSVVSLGPLPVVSTVFGNPQVAPETLLAYELGHRIKLGRKVSFDTAAYYNHYGTLRSTQQFPVEFVLQPAPPHVVVPIQFSQMAKGTAMGLESVMNWDVIPRWRLTSSYSYGQLAIGSSQGGSSATSVYQSAPGAFPRHQAQIRSYWDINAKLQLDASAWYVNRLPSQQLPSYTTVDLRLGWRPVKPLELNVSVSNLFNRIHVEGPTDNFVVYRSQAFGRMGSVGVTWHF
jgi:iron complex outermembrane receptor protein